MKKLIIVFLILMFCCSCFSEKTRILSTDNVQEMQIKDDCMEMCDINVLLMKNKIESVMSLAWYDLNFSWKGFSSVNEISEDYFLNYFFYNNKNLLEECGEQYENEQGITDIKLCFDEQYVIDFLDNHFLDVSFDMNKITNEYWKKDKEKNLFIINQEDAKPNYGMIRVASIDKINIDNINSTITVSGGFMKPEKANSHDGSLFVATFKIMNGSYLWESFCLVENEHYLSYENNTIKHRDDIIRLLNYANRYFDLIYTEYSANNNAPLVYIDEQNESWYELTNLEWKTISQVKDYLCNVFNKANTEQLLRNLNVNVREIQGKLCFTECERVGSLPDFHNESIIVKTVTEEYICFYITSTFPQTETHEIYLVKNSNDKWVLGDGLINIYPNK